MRRFVMKKKVDAYVLISHLSGREAQQIEIRLRADEEWLAFLHFSPEPPPANGRNGRGIPQLYVAPDQYEAVIDLLRHEKPVWFTLYEAPLSGWLSSSSATVGGGIAAPKGETS